MNVLTTGSPGCRRLVCGAGIPIYRDSVRLEP